MTQEALKLALKFVEDSECGTADLEARIKEALAQTQEPVCPDCKAKVLYECVACSSNNYPPQRTEQEPVAYLCENAVGHRYFRWKKPSSTYKPLPLYTTSPQRTWVGLTDEEIDYLIHLAYTGDEEFVQTIEAKLKEKNLPCIKPKWIGLTEKEHTDVAVECGCMSADWVFYGAAVERKLKERNT